MEWVYLSTKLLIVKLLNPIRTTGNDRSFVPEMIMCDTERQWVTGWK